MSSFKSYKRLTNKHLLISILYPAIVTQATMFLCGFLPALILAVALTIQSISIIK